MTFPATSTWMSCHARGQRQTGHREARSIRQVRTAHPLGSGVPGHPGRHLDPPQAPAGGHAVAMCHGNVAQLDSMSELTAVTSMASCISCHQTHNAPVVCQTCHAWPASSSPPPAEAFFNTSSLCEARVLTILPSPAVCHIANMCLHSLSCENVQGLIGVP